MVCMTYKHKPASNNEIEKLVDIELPQQITHTF